MKKAILFSFETHRDNASSYALTMEVARHKKLPVILFTTVPEQFTEADRDEVYLHLLHLNGYYLTQHNAWNRPQHIRTHRVIKKGDFETALTNFIENTNIDLEVVPPIYGNA